MGLPAGDVTFLFSDVEGSTRLFRAIGARYPPLLERHGELLRAAWTRHGGVEVSTEGDAFFVAVDDAESAIAAAVDAQHSLSAEPWPPDAVFRVRIGIHSGMAAPRHGDYVAFAVHQAARAVDAGHGRQVVVSATSAEMAELPSAASAVGGWGEVDPAEIPDLIWALGDKSLRRRPRPIGPAGRCARTGSGRRRRRRAPR